MQYILTSGWDDGIADLTERLAKELAGGKHVLWLTSGGSNISASVQIMDNIAEDLTANLTVMPLDERYGPVGHADSNWFQLLQAGFRPAQAKLLPVLQDGLSLGDTAAHFQDLYQQAIADNNISIAQIGIGTDGHVAGILPNSPAAQSEAIVVGYEWADFKRLTPTFNGLRKLSAAYVFAFGEPKYPALESLLNQNLPLKQQPAQILKELPEAYVYNDQLRPKQ